MLVRVKTSELADIPALEKHHGGKLLRAEILGDEAVVEFLPVASLEFFVDVWNCQGTVVLVKEGEEIYIDEDEGWEYDPELYNRLVEHVVYDDNDGAINWSGRYWPQSKESLQLFRTFLGTLKRKECHTTGATPSAG